MTNIDPAIVEALHAAHADEFTALKDDRYSDVVPASECGNCQRWAKYAAPLLTAALAERDAARAEVARLRAAVEGAQRLSERWNAVADRVPEPHADVYWRHANALLNALSPVITPLVEAAGIVPFVGHDAATEDQP